MFLSDFSIRKPVATVVVIIGLMLLGLLALSKLRVNQFPDIEPPVLVINVPYPGASPETVEREVVNRIEKSLQSISGVDRSESTSREGSATIVLVFDFSKNMIEAAEEVRNAISGGALQAAHRDSRTHHQPRRPRRAAHPAAGAVSAAA
jgi:HAE1 family hydrophobic/amphiphilic exporter-1